MFRIVYEIVLRGLSEELDCLSKLYSVLSSRGVCVGSQTMFVCSYGGATVVKVTPHSPKSTQDVQLYRGVVQPLTITIIIEGGGAESVVDSASVVYTLVKGCGLSIRLLSE